MECWTGIPILLAGGFTAYPDGSKMDVVKIKNEFNIYHSVFTIYINHILVDTINFLWEFSH
jgi:hypothetical protein